MLLISASEKAPRAIGIAKMVGRAQINGTTVTRSVQLASMAWPVRDASGEIPKPRLMADVPISVTDAEGAPITVAAREDKFWEAKAGEKLTIPLKLTWRSEVSGQLRLRPYGAAISGLKPLEVAAKAETADLVLDLATLKPAPGEHTVALASGYVVKYRHNPAAVILAEAAQKKAEQEVAAVAAEAKKLSAEVTAAPAEKRAAVETAAKAAEAKLKSAEAAKAEAAKRVKAATDAATPKDIADIVVSEPIRIRVLPADKK
ncbi:MAG: hypothetical protein EB141_16235 [Verrucomicrobia bacterium]|nr:hypothetical protein [Verrucomicrobiota bacterium]